MIFDISSDFLWLVAGLYILYSTLLFYHQLGFRACQRKLQRVSYLRESACRAALDRDSCEGNKFLKTRKVFPTCLGFGTVLPIHSLKMSLQNLTQPTYYQPPSNSQDNLQGLFSMVHGYLGLVQPNSFPKGKNHNDSRSTFHIINIHFSTECH